MCYIVFVRGHMPYHRRRPLTEAEIAEIRRHGPGFWTFKRAKDNRKQARISRYIAYAIASVIVVGWGYLLYKYIISGSAFIVFVGHVFDK